MCQIFQDSVKISKPILSFSKKMEISKEITIFANHIVWTASCLAVT